jgi:hypothetical protein
MAELEGMPRSSVSPAGFGGVNFSLPGTRGGGFSIPSLNFFTASLFQRGVFLHHLGKVVIKILPTLTFPQVGIKAIEFQAFPATSLFLSRKDIHKSEGGQVI